MKWWQVALAVASNPLMRMVPIVGQIVPFIADGVMHAQQLHGDTNNDHKRQIVIDAALAASSTGKVKVDPIAAVAVTNAVLDAIDQIHAVVKANQAPAVGGAPAGV